MAKRKLRILLAWGEANFTKKLKGVLEERGHPVAILRNGASPKARYDIIVQLGRDPADLAEGTRDLLKKTKTDKARFFLIHFRTDKRLYNESVKFAKSLASDFEQKHGTSTTILNLSRIYGPGVEEEYSGALAHLIREFSEEDFLTLYGEGKDSDYYLYINDVLEAVAQAIENLKPADTYAVSSQVAITSEAIAKLLFELGGGRHEIRFHRGLTSVKEGKAVEGELLPNFTPKTPFRDGIMMILKTHEKPKTKKAKAKKLPKLRAPLIKIKIKPKKPTKKEALVLGALLVILAPILYLGGHGAFAAYNLSKTLNALKSFDLATVQTASAKAASSLGKIEKIFPPAESVKELSSAASEVAEAASAAEDMLANLSYSFKGETFQPQSEEDFDQLTRALKTAEEKETLAWLKLNQLGKPWKSLLTQVTERLKEGIRATRLATTLSKKAWELLGYRGEKNYLVLFQNSAEARAGGGYLGSFARLTLKNGGIESLEFFDSYQFDSEKRITPSHPALSYFRNNKTHPLRASNVWASFPESAKDIANIFEDARDEEIEGILGMTLTFAKEILSVAGEINLPEFERTINADNLFEITTQEVEQDFFPGTTKKKRFMQSLGEALIDKLFSLGKESYVGIAQAKWKSLKEKNLLAYFRDGEVAQELYNIGFDGHVIPTQGDYLYVLDTSYGTKVNEVWLKRKVDYEVKNVNRNGALEATTTITWEHTGTDAWPSGTYVNLLRVLVPKGSNLKEATLNDKDYLSGIFKTEEAGKTEFAAYLRVEPQTTSVLKLTYRLPLNTQDLKTYSLAVQKQPGTVGDIFNFTFEEPFDKTAESENLQKVDNRFIFEGRLVNDLDVKITLKEK